MKKLIEFILFSFYSLIYSQQNSGVSGSKLFFFNQDIGSIIKENQTILVTSNGAANWNAVAVPDNKKPEQILFTTETNSWLLADETVFNSTDGGLTWNGNNVFNSLELKSLFFINENMGFVGGGGMELSEYKSVIFFTTDAGLSWEKAVINDNANTNVVSISFADENFGIAVTPTNIYKTTDGGKNWNRLALQFQIGEGGLTGGKIFDEDNILLSAWEPNVVAEGYLLSSSDGGETWTEQYERFDWGITDYFFYDKNTFWVTTIDNVFYSNDAGSSWSAYRTRCDEFSFFEKHKAYGLLDGNLIYTEDGWGSYIVVDSTLTGIDDEISQPEEFKLYQNYPNPFGKSSYSGSQSTTIAFELPSEDVVKINIYNSIGEIVKSVKEKRYSAGRHEYFFNAGNLSSGIYLYQIQTKKFQDTKKFVFFK